MFQADHEERVLMLSDLLNERRSVRRFQPEAPSEADIETILEAGMLGPFEEASVGGFPDFRRFVVLSRDSVALIELTGHLSRRAAELLAQSEPRLPEPVRAKLTAAATGSLPGLGTAPWFIVVAERRGVPEAQRESIAHCLQNMWLMATALGLGAHLVSITRLVADDSAACRLLGLEVGAFELNGFAVGLPWSIPPARPRPDLRAVTTWLR